MKRLRLLLGLFIVLMTTQAYSQEKERNTILHLGSGLAIQNTFLYDDGRGDMHFGVSFNAGVDFRIHKNFYWTTEMSYMYGWSYEDNATRLFNIYGTYFSSIEETSQRFFLMTGISYRKQLSDDVIVHGAILGGYLNFQYHSTTSDAFTSLEVRNGTGAGQANLGFDINVYNHQIYIGPEGNLYVSPKSDAKYDPYYENSQIDPYYNGASKGYLDYSVGVRVSYTFRR